jgi:simple sugar transport system ATP-binding protein
MSIAVQMSGITKSFGSVAALNKVDLTVKAGEIHAIVGENGAGKSTLMKVLFGAYQADSGTISVCGNPVHIKSQVQAAAVGIGMVSQHYSIIPQLTCLQNLMLGAEPGFKINQTQSRERAQILAGQMGFEFDWLAPASELSPAQGQKLEILKLLWRNAKILILDEPTAMLAPEDAENLYEKLHQLADSGSSILVVTHRLPEVFTHCDQVTVLRGGTLIATSPVNQTDPRQVAEQMIGAPVMSSQPQASTPGAPILRVDNLTVKGDQGEIAVNSASFQLHRGELVGIAGVDGSGQRELFQALMGLRLADGTIQLGQDHIQHLGPAQRIAKGIHLIAEDRHHEAVIEEWTITENCILTHQRNPGLADHKSHAHLAERITTRFPTKFASIRQPLDGLSGGNQQKVVVARALEFNPQVILAFQPTRGIDLYVAGLVYDELIKATRAGATTLVVSFDLDELMAHADRLLVLNHGVLTQVPENLRHDRQAIGRMMVGAQ